VAELAGPRKGRAAVSNADSRFNRLQRETLDDGWNNLEDGPEARKTWVTEETAKTIISRNDSPDIPFEQSINAYRGCEHGCIYCYARPTHAYHNLSPGLDFETRLFAKHNAVELLRKELARRGYRPSVIALGANTDPYQPIERQRRLTRGILEVLAECGHPVNITTKSALIERDLDLLAPMAEEGLARGWISITTLDGEKVDKAGDTMTGALIMSGAAIQTAQGSDIASASTINRRPSIRVDSPSPGMPGRSAVTYTAPSVGNSLPAASIAL